MTNAFRCPETGLVDFFDEPGSYPCQYCGGEHHTYEAGTPLKMVGPPMVIGDRLPKHHDYSCGCDIESKSQRRRIYAAKGLNVTSIAEHTKQNPEVMPRRHPVVSYAGQTHRETRKGRREV